MTIKIFSFILNFAPTLLISELVCCSYLKRRKYFFITFPLLFVAFVSVFNNTFDFANEIYRFLNLFDGFAYVVIYLISCGVLFGLFSVGITQALYIGAVGYTVEHLIHNTKFIVRSLFYSNGRNISYYIVALLIEVVVNVLIYFFFVRKILRKKSSYTVGINLLISVITVALVAVLSSQVNSIANAGIVIYIYGLVMCIALLALQVLLMRFFESANDKLVMKQLLTLNEKQYRMTKENIDLINRKCHDLKHQIAALEKLDNIAEREKAVSELKKAVEFYDGVVKTDNDTLNIILTDKNLVCREAGITFTYVIDASKICFIEEMDLYTLFGNLIDNAIDAVSKLEKDLRIITLKIGCNDFYLKIGMENFLEGELKFVNGLPQSTKEQNGYHGYGVRSIKYIVEKYKGNMVLRQDGNMFLTDIVIPIPKVD